MVLACWLAVLDWVANELLWPGDRQDTRTCAEGHPEQPGIIVLIAMTIVVSILVVVLLLLLVILLVIIIVIMIIIVIGWPSFSAEVGSRRPPLSQPRAGTHSKRHGRCS